MRICKQCDPIPKVGDRRTIKKFLLFPKSLPLCSGSVIELRWLEQATIIQEYGEFASSYDEPPMCSWEDICWGESDHE